MASPSKIPITGEMHQTQPVTTRETALEKELQHLTRINSTLCLLHDSIFKISQDMDKLNKATSNTMEMMSKWTKIIQQANFTHEMIDNKQWNPSKQEKQEQERINQSENTNDDDDDDEEDKQLRILARKLIALESENMILNRSLEREVSEKRDRWNKAEEMANKRKRELGLLNTAGDSSRRKLNG
ncbi:hypothetical protein KGF56_001510 [Candida oxycetoniae]|uniref:DASH complex subunit DUO1 n=1 Tax=Candida oxycetoniae TaxID=497107 RepID=A0AAI9SZ84_9ASCO|nr:uncharacterized protein KGF56_001510 [Candida oxycetoniae]KAI3405492.2 hypothetical protein KGF56_001510 [Candida oxycetoniae]